MIREDANLPLHGEMYAVTLVTARIKETGMDGSINFYDKFFTCKVGQTFSNSGVKIAQIVWNKNWLLEQGISRWEIWVTDQQTTEPYLWQWFDNPISANPILDKN